MELKNQLPKIMLSYEFQLDPNKRTTISTSKDAWHVVRPHYKKETIELREEFKVLLLNRGNQCLGVYEHAYGGRSGVVVDVSQLVAIASLSNSTGIILTHNHPSSNLKPSLADRKITQEIKYALGFLKIEVLDHLIITKDEYYSFADDEQL